jgi:hypothetical protein
MMKLLDVRAVKYTRKLLCTADWAVLLSQY